MAIIGIEHVNIRTACLPETIHFYRDILGMTVAPPPGRSDLSDGAWVYGSDGSAVLHIGDAALVCPGETQAPATVPSDTGTIHHVALSCDDYGQVRELIEADDIALTANDLPQFNLRQIFIRDPNGVLVELNFHSV